MKAKMFNLCALSSHKDLCSLVKDLKEIPTLSRLYWGRLIKLLLAIVETQCSVTRIVLRNLLTTAAARSRRRKSPVTTNEENGRQEDQKILAMVPRETKAKKVIDHMSKKPTNNIYQILN